VLNIGPGELILLTLILGLVCAALAHRKGLRPGPFFVLGVVLPVIGLIITIAMPPSQVQQSVEPAPEN
jgi:hypothetical protein